HPRSTLFPYTTLFRSHLPFGAVDHDRHARDVRLAGDQVQETHHGCLAVEHGLIHVDVDDLSAVLHLLAGDGEGLLELAVQDEARDRKSTRLNSSHDQI